MIPRPISQVPSAGCIALAYGEPGVGKTTSTLLSLPGRVLWVRVDEKSEESAIHITKDRAADIDVADYSGFLELIEFFSNVHFFDSYKSIFIDTFSFLSNVKLSIEIENEAYESRKSVKDSKESKMIKTLVEQSKLSQEGFGCLSSQLKRLLNLLGMLAKQGKYIVLSCWMVEHPKWDRELCAAPALKGSDFPSNMSGYLNLIGFVTERRQAVKNNKGETVGTQLVYPPGIQFKSPNGEFLCKWSGDPNSAGRFKLDWSNIFNQIKGGETVKDP